MYHIKTTWRRILGGLLVLTIGALPACNTMEGAGKDVKKTGEKIEDKARDAK